MSRLLSVKFIKNELKKVSSNIANIEKKLRYETAKKKPREKIINSVRKDYNNATSLRNLLRGFDIGAETTSKGVGTKGGDAGKKIKNNE